MGKSYSSDLRKRVVRFVDAGHSRREAAQHFGVSPSFAVKLEARRRDHGSIEPAVQGRPKGSGKLAAQMEFLTGRVKAQPDITMPELAAELLAARGVKVNPASLSRVPCNAGFT